MKHSLKTGLGFGVTSGVITTLGLLVGLHAGTQSRLAVIGGILTIGIADAFSDSLGVHISKEFEKKTTKREIWESTIITFLSKFLIALTFMIPILSFNLSTAIKINLAWGFLILGCFSYIIAKERKVPPCHVISEHLFIATVVILTVQYLGNLIRDIFI